ncbi:unnamed protein product [Notodromas monacha]|uniref:Uncharacterized protein n=1 Tax=Notodromas monacha TaxID=399045 RepID=A0A7R9BMY9_9CRUS|nr:unnamed protein product [Notodromas monacha]CAG0917383.1 unnamed protein product [Notodromas monacha]
MADWARCYPDEPVSAEIQTGNTNTNSTAGEEASEEVGEECTDEGQLYSRPPLYLETQTATVSLIREADGDGHPVSLCDAANIDLSTAKPYLDAIAGSKREAAASLRNRKHFSRVPGPPGFLRSFPRADVADGICGLTRESARLKAIKDLSPTMYKYGTEFEEEALDFYRREFRDLNDLKRTWDQIDADCFQRQEKTVKSGEPTLIIQRDGLRQDICVMLAELDCYNREIGDILIRDDYKRELLEKLGKASSEVKQANLLISLAKDEYEALIFKEKEEKFIRPELVGKCACSEYLEIIEEITQLTVDGDALSSEYQLWQKLIKDFGRATREIIRTIITDWNTDGEVHKYIKAITCLAKECAFHDNIRCIFSCPPPEQVAKMICCELDCTINSANAIRRHYNGI